MNSTTDVNAETLINSAEFSKILGGWSTSYIHTMRKRGEGPPHIRRGRLVLYRLSDCVEFAEIHNTPQ